MNLILREEIVKHIFSNFGIISSNHVNLNNSHSLLSKEFCLKDIISFENGNTPLNNKVWGCQTTIQNKEIKILLADCSIDNIKEYALFIQMKDQPSYGLYFVERLNEGLIAISTSGKEWLECSTYLQATFLAAMESVKDLSLQWNICKDYSTQFGSLLSFIRFHSDLFGDFNEG